VRRPTPVKLVLIALLLLCGSWKGWADDKYYVQLIKATNKSDPPKKGAKPIGAKLGEQLSPLRWKYYWEVERRDASVPSDRSKRVDLPGERAIEVMPAVNGKVEVRLYRGKNLSRKSCHKVNDRMMAIFGGDEGERAWFVVVRRQEPQYEVAKQ
jgi:hypothetical protein